MMTSPDCNLAETAQVLRDSFYVVDVETTGLGEQDTVVEIAVVDCATRETLLNCLIRPGSPMGSGAASVHGISEGQALKEGKNLAEQLSALFTESDQKSPGSLKYLTAYNLPFDRRLIMQSLYKEPVTSRADAQTQFAAISGLSIRTNQPFCVMELANRFFVRHAAWDTERSCFKRLSLEQCLELAGIEREGHAHRALSDALATVDLIHYMAQHKTC